MSRHRFPGAPGFSDDALVLTSVEAGWVTLHATVGPDGPPYAPAPYRSCRLTLSLHRWQRLVALVDRALLEQAPREDSA